MGSAPAVRQTSRALPCEFSKTPTWESPGKSNGSQVFPVGSGKKPCTRVDRSTLGRMICSADWVLPADQLRDADGATGTPLQSVSLPDVDDRRFSGGLSFCTRASDGAERGTDVYVMCTHGLEHPGTS